MTRLVHRNLPLVFALVLFADLVAAAPQRSVSNDADRLVSTLAIPGGLDRLLTIAGVVGLTDPGVAMPAFIRAVHVLPDKPRTDLPALFNPAARLRVGDAPVPTPPAGPPDLVPLPLTADWWCAVVLQRQVPAAQLAAAIFTERRPAFIYLGLLSLDDETLAYFAQHGGVIGALSPRGAGAFGQWGRSIHIAQGKVQVPGGDAALWQELVGEAPADPDKFVRALLSKDEGRAAYFYDAVTHLDPARQAFALAATAGAKRADRVKALYSAVANTKAILSSGDWPTVRHPFGPMSIVRQAKVETSGAMAPPASRALWEAVIGGDRSGCRRAASGGPAADAGWLAERIEREFLEVRGHWVATVAFAQRVFAGASQAELPVVCEALNAFPRANGLLLALERMGVRTPADYVAALRFADRAWTGTDRRAAVLRSAQIQGIVQALQQAVSVRALPPERARELLLSLVEVGGAADGTWPPGAIGRWLQATLLRGACPGLASADACLVHLASGDGHPGRTVIEWEDDRYVVDLGAATKVRLERVLRGQHATRIDDGLALLDAAATFAHAHPTGADLERAALVLKSIAPSVVLNDPTLFGHPVPPVRQDLEAAFKAASATASESSRTAAAKSVEEVAQVLLADALASFAYATGIGDPDDAVLMGGNPARQHLFDGKLGPATEAWHLAEEVQAIDRSWLVEGSVLALRTLYPKSWLRRLSVHDPGAAIRPDPQDVRVVGESATAFSPFDLSDEARDQIVAAIRRGRARAAELIASPPALWAAARETGLGEWRCRAALWMHAHLAVLPPARRVDPASYFSRAELLWLGKPTLSADAIDAWGVATRPIDGALGVRMPRWTTWESYQGPRGVGQLATQMADVHLAVAEALSDLKLPAVLAPDVAAQASWDVMAAARMANRDDWFALVRAAQEIPRDRFLDYVSALTAIGPLVPIR
jgi:hypothetical protein